MPAENATVYGVCNAYRAVEIIIVILCYINVWLTLSMLHSVPADMGNS